MENIKTIHDYTPEQIAEFWDAIDIGPVNDFATKMLGLTIKLQKFTDGDRKDYHGQIVRYISDERNIAPLDKITEAAWRKMIVRTFNSQIVADKESGNLRYWGTLSLQYENWGGGYNSTNIADIEFKNGEWTLRAAKDGRQ